MVEMLDRAREDREAKQRDAMTTGETAQELGVAPKTLEKWRTKYKDGHDEDGNPVPPEYDLEYYHVGSMVRYSRKVVEAFKAANRSKKIPPIDFAKPKRKRKVGK
ncbi:MAG TPA: transposase [Candidatus Acidoferrum sp.]|nr:transposase [Candidatus Acidoferrum sp.]